MKKSLTIFLVLFVATGLILASDFAFTGEFRGGYKFLCGSSTAWASHNDWGNGGELKLNFAIKGDFWTINVKNLTGDQLVDPTFGENGRFAANIEVNIDKLIDMGDLKFSLNAGENSNVSALSSFNDVSKDGYYKVKVNGNYIGQAKFAYKDLKFEIYFDPTQGNTLKSQNSYGEYGATIQETFANGAISASATYVHGAKFKFSSENDRENRAVFNPDIAISNLFSKHGIGLSAKVDVSKLTGAENKFIISCFDNMAPDANINFSNFDLQKSGNLYSDFANTLGLNLQAGKGKLSGWAEFRLVTMLNIVEASSVNSKAIGNVVVPGFMLNTKYDFTDLWSLGVTGGIENCNMPSRSWRIVGTLAYSIFNLDFGYRSSEKYFHFKPYFKVVF